MATFRKRNDPSAIASEGELRVTILCCTNFSEENTFIGCRRKRYRVQVEFGMREFKTMWDNGASSSCAVWDQSFRAYINSELCQNMRLIVKSAHVVKPRLVGYADINLSDALCFRECHISTPLYKEGIQTCTVSAIVRFIPLSELHSIASSGSLTLPGAPGAPLPQFSFHTKVTSPSPAIVSPSSPNCTTSNNTSPRSTGQVSHMSDATSTSGVVRPFVRVGGVPNGLSAPCSPALGSNKGPVAASHAMYGCMDSAAAMKAATPPSNVQQQRAQGPLPAAPHIVPLATPVPPVRQDSLTAASCKAVGGSHASSRSVSEDGSGNGGIIVGGVGSHRLTRSSAQQQGGVHSCGGSSASNTPVGSSTPRRRSVSVERLTVPTISSLNKQQQGGGIGRRSGSNTPCAETPTTPRRGAYPTSSKPPTSPHAMHAVCAQLAGVLTGGGQRQTPGSTCSTPTAAAPARIRTTPSQHNRAPQPESPTGHWFQHTSPSGKNTAPQSGVYGTPKHSAQDLERILQNVSTLVAPSPMDPSDHRETVLPPALAAQFCPLARSVSQLMVHCAVPSTSAAADPTRDALCGVYIPPWEGPDDDDDGETPFAYGSPLARGASGEVVALGPFGLFEQTYRPVARKWMKLIFGR